MFRMKRDFLSQVEKNIEVQAGGLLAMAREDQAFSQARGELARLEIADRLRAKIGKSIKVLIIEIGWFEGTVQQVFLDHLLLKIHSKLWLIKFFSLQAVQRLEQGVKKPNRLEKNWTISSTFRDWMIDQTKVTIRTVQGLSINGEITRIYQDHLEIGSALEVTAVPFQAILVAMRNYEI